MKINPVILSHSLLFRSFGRSAASLLALVLAVLAFLCAPAHGQTIFTGADGPTSNPGADPGAYDYNDPNNWSTTALPGTGTGGHALINNGDTVNYFGGSDGGDFFIGDGGILEIADGTWHQVVNNNYIQMTGDATILVDGGTFDQGTSSANPFNLNGSTGNVFEITSGSAVFNENVGINTGLTYEQSGGTVTVTANEFDYNTPNGTIISGGVLNVNLITGVNSGGLGVLTLSGGVINLGPGGIYAPSAATPVNFTTGSTGEVTFPATDFSTSTLQGWVNNGGFSYNGTTDASAFQVVTNGSQNVVELVPGSVPEPQTWAMIIGGVGALYSFQRIRRRIV